MRERPARGSKDSDEGPWVLSPVVSMTAVKAFTALPSLRLRAGSYRIDLDTVTRISGAFRPGPAGAGIVFRGATP